MKKKIITIMFFVLLILIFVPIFYAASNAILPAGMDIGADMFSGQYSQTDSSYIAGRFIGIILWSLLPGFIAKHKGRNFFGYYFLSWLISPLFSTIIVLCLKNLSLKPTVKYEESAVPTYKIAAAPSSNADSNTVCKVSPSAEQVSYKSVHFENTAITPSADVVTEKAEKAFPAESDTVKAPEAITNPSAETHRTEDILSKEENTAINSATATENQINYCHKCGSKLVERSLFCHKCGQSIPQK